MSHPAKYPPQIAKNAAKVTNIGNTITAAIILGKTKYEVELIPITSKASICSVIRIVPNSPAIFEPTFPAKTIPVMVGANSKIVESLTIKEII